MAAAAAGVLVPAWAGAAGTDTWTGGSSVNWTDAGNWLGNVAPAAGDGLVFAGTTRLTNTNDFAANTGFAGITFDATAGAFTLGGNAVLLTGDVNDNSTAAQQINFAPVNFTTGTSGKAQFTYATGGLVLDGSTSNVNVAAGGSLSLGQVTLGAVAQSANVSTLNINNSVSASGLTVQTNSSSANTINIAAGQTFGVGGSVYLGTPATASGQSTIRTNVNFTGGGTFSATAGNFYVGLGTENLGSGDHNTAVVNMTGLGGFSYTGGGNFGVGWMTRPYGELRLTPGTNTIVAASLRVGESGVTGSNGSADNNNGAGATLYLGAGTNVIQASAIAVGQTKGNGAITWQDPSNGSVTIAGLDGVSRANITIGNLTSGGGTGTASQVLLAGHNANVLADTVIVGRVSGSTGSPSLSNLLTFDKGTFDVNSLQLAVNAGTGASANGSSGTFTLGTDSSSTGVLTVNNSFFLGNDSNTASGTPTKAIFTINGGTANVNANIQVVTNDSDAYTGSDVFTVNLAGGTLNMTGHNVGSAAAPVKALNLSGGTLANVGTAYGSTINVTAPLSVSGPVTLAMGAGGLNNNTGSTLVLPSGLTVAGPAGATGVVNGGVEAGAGSVVAPGTASAAGTLQFNNDLTFDANSTMMVKLSPDSTSGNDLVGVNGNLTLNGPVNLQIGALGLGATIGSTYKVATYGGTLSGSETSFNVIGPGSRKTFTVVPTAGTPNEIDVLVGGTEPQAITYVGNAGSTWVVGATGPLTWRNDATSSADQFYNVDSVTFDDTSTNPSDVTVPAAVQPSNVVVSANRNYKFVGAGGIVGTTGLTKALGGTLTLATNNTYTGTTDIQAGTVVVGDGGTVGTLGTGAVNDNGTLAFNRSDNVTVANAIGGSGNVEVDGTGVTALTGTSTYAGTTTVNAGTLKVSGGASTGDTNGAAITVKSGATLDIGGNTTANNYNLGAKTVHIAGNGAGGTAGAIANSGGAAQNAAFNNITLDADALIAGARMDIGRNTAVATRTLDLQGHTLTTAMTGSQPIFGILDGTTVTAGNIVVSTGGLDPERSAVIDDIGGTITFNTGTVLQVFQNADGSVKRPMVFKGSNTIGSGSTTTGVINSPMRLDGTVTLQSVGSGVPNAANNPMELKGAISGVGGITKVGTNSVTLSGAQTYAGATAVNGGTLVIGGSSTGSSSLAVADNAVVQTTAGTVETLRFGGLNLNASGKMDIVDDRLVIGGGTSPATVLGYIQRGYAGGAWNGNGLTSSAAQGSSIKGLGWAVVDSTGINSWGSATGLAASDIVVRMTYIGDLNLDGVVNGGDYALLDRGFAEGLTGWVNGDVNYDGVVDANDYLAVDTTYGQQGGPLSADFLAQREAEFGSAYVSALVAAVPEPTSCGLIVACGSLLVVGRRRRRA